MTATLMSFLCSHSFGRQESPNSSSSFLSSFYVMMFAVLVCYLWSCGFLSFSSIFKSDVTVAFAASYTPTFSRRVLFVYFFPSLCSLSLCCCGYIDCYCTFILPNNGIGGLGLAWRQFHQEKQMSHNEK